MTCETCNYFSNGNCYVAPEVKRQAWCESCKDYKPKQNIKHVECCGNDELVCTECEMAFSGWGVINQMNGEIRLYCPHCYMDIYNKLPLSHEPIYHRTETIAKRAIDFWEESTNV